MKHLILSAVLLWAFNTYGQNESLLKRIFEIGKPIVFKSEFNNHHYRFKDGNELVSPGYTTTYLFFDENT